MSETTFLTNHFLIAMPGLADPNFTHTVTYICEHSAEGALGIIINRPLEITMGEVLNHMDIRAQGGLDVQARVFSGGPVQEERGFVLHSPRGEWDSSLRVTDNIAVTTSRDILDAIATAGGPKKYLLALGYAGWGAGQLETELAQNAWLSGPAEPEIIFDLEPEKRLDAAASLLGIDLRLLSGDVGHA